MTNIDDIRAEIMARIEAAESDLARIEIEKADAAATLRARRAEFSGFERAVGAMREAQAEPPAAPAKRQRRDIRGAVRAAFGEYTAGYWLEEAPLAEHLGPVGIKPEALHSYLLRAVKTGEVERDGSLYRLPKAAPGQDDFAAATVTRTAAE